MMEIDEFLEKSGVELRTVELWISREWLIPDRSGRRAAFDEIDAARARFIRDLKTDFGVNDEGVEVVLHLFDQLNGMRQAMADLREEFLRSQKSSGRSTSKAPRRRP